ncbi:MAG: hypothetical protein ACRC2V_26930 [Xenococcaceae cyanobacterium]
MGKMQIKLTLKPENIKWLKAEGNASALVDYLVEFARNEHKALKDENQRLKEQAKKDKKAYLKEIIAPLNDIVAKSDRSETGYRSNAFGKGLKALKELLEQLSA